jgi:hypothetical protein
MATHLSPQDQQLLRVIGEVLHYIWDPIGVSGVPQARDEYDGYVGPLFTLLCAGAEESEISTHLERIAGDRMGLPGHKEKSDEAAAVLTDWRDFHAEVGA